jgi:hypothetical protein
MMCDDRAEASGLQQRLSMRQATWLSVLVFFLAVSAHASDALVVTTSDGQVRGTLGNGVREWKGIPYPGAACSMRRDSAAPVRR